MHQGTTARGAAFVALAAVLLAAQQPDGPYWSTIPVPAGFTSVSTIGTSGTIKATGSVTFFSAVLRTFTTVAVSPAATVSSFNGYCMITDGTTITAYCTRTGVASPLSVSPSAVLTNGPPTSTWTSVVVDGTQAWGYGAFAGNWAPLTLAAANPQVAAGNNCLLIWDGVQLHALSSLTSAWTSITPTEPIVGIAAGGFAGLAWGATTVFGFSNHTQQWTSHAFSAAAAPTFKDNYAYFSNGGLEFLFYSAITQTYAYATTAAVTVLLAGANCAVLSDGVSTSLYASPHGVLVPSPWNPTMIAFNSEWAILDDGGALHAFSGVTGTFAPPLTGLFAVGGNEDVAFATGTPSYAYSPIQNAWTQAPPGTPTSVSYIRNGVILVRPNGYDGFCARTGAFSSVNTTGPTSVSTLSNSSTFCVYDGATIGVFDSRLGRWSATPTVTTPAVSIWRSTLLANDGANAYGFAMTNSVWDSIPLASPPLQMAANSSVGFVRTSTAIHMYSPLGSLSTLSRYPEFSRMQARGSLIRYMQIGPPGAHVTAALATAGGFLPLPPLGIAFIDLNALVGTVDLGTIPASGMLDLSFLVPNDPALNNRALYLQDLIVPVSGSPYVTNLIAPIVM